MQLPVRSARQCMRFAESCSLIIVTQEGRACELMGYSNSFMMQEKACRQSCWHVRHRVLQVVALLVLVDFISL